MKTKKRVLKQPRNLVVLKEARMECSLRTRTIKDKKKYDSSVERRINKQINF